MCTFNGLFVIIFVTFVVKTLFLLSAKIMDGMSVLMIGADYSSNKSNFRVLSQRTLTSRDGTHSASTRTPASPHQHVGVRIKTEPGLKSENTQKHLLKNHVKATGNKMGMLASDCVYLISENT